MECTARKRWPVSVVVLVGVLVIAGVVFSGCSPATEESATREDKSQPKESTTPEDKSQPKESTTPADKSPPEVTESPPIPGAPEPPAPPQVSTFAPAEDLVGQVEYYVERLSEAVESEEAYSDSVEKVAKDANTLIVIALALGLHDEDNKHKGVAPLLVKQAQELAATKDHASAKAAVAAVKRTLIGASSPYAAELKWEKVASLEQLMKQVPLINTRLKRYAKGSRFQSKAKDTAGYSAVIAVIAQGTLADAHEAKSADEVQQWYDFCIQMREAAGEVNAGIRALDEEATAAAMVKLQQSCDDCHAVFHEVEAP